MSVMLHTSLFYLQIVLTDRHKPGRLSNIAAIIKP